MSQSMKVLKPERYTTEAVKNNELDLFIVEEIKDHLDQLHNLVNEEQPDHEKAAYHHEKILRFMKRIEISLGGA